MSARSAAADDRSRGFTAIELLVTLTVIAIVTALAVPSLREFVQNNRAAAAANALVGALALARNEAITRGLPVSVCASADGETCDVGDKDWSPGWIVFTDAVAPTGAVNAAARPDTVLRAYPALAGGSVMTATDNFVPIRANGFLGGAAAVTFTLQVPDCTTDHNRNITINLQGRAGVAHANCS